MCTTDKFRHNFLTHSKHAATDRGIGARVDFLETIYWSDATDKAQNLMDLYDWAGIVALYRNQSIATHAQFKLLIIRDLNQRYLQDQVTMEEQCPVFRWHSAASECDVKLKGVNVHVVTFVEAPTLKWRW